MNAPNFEIEEIFAHAIDLQPGNRLDYVRERCGENLEQFEMVMALIRGHERNRQDQFLEDQVISPNTPSVDSDFFSDSPSLQKSSTTSFATQNNTPVENHPSHSTFDRLKETTAENTVSSKKLIGEQIGDVIDRYRLSKRIGEGGMGTVYLAEQTSDVKRQVALKIIKLGMDTQQVCDRFETERQAMAMFEHPNIARVLDAGSTESGRPYFVMEWVQGTTITKFCDQQQLGLNDRLELFASLCRAVRHAHQKGIVHRDLKPGNILVSVIDGKPHPKVIDFGIAKALNGDLNDSTSITSSSALIGTPQYMSPEQAKFGQIEIDQRTDVYSLGIVLHELLTGKTPLNGEDLKRANPLALYQTIEKAVFPLPSSVLKNSKTRPQNGIRPKQLKGGIDNVITKAISFHPEDRYENVDSLLLDIENLISGNPVTAQKPNPFLGAKRFFVKHQASAAICFLFAVFTCVTAYVCQQYASQAYRSSVAHAETKQQLKTEQNEKKAVKQQLEIKDKKLEINRKELLQKKIQLDFAKRRELLEDEKARYHKAHMNTINSFLDHINGEANAIQVELIAESFGEEQRDKVLEELIVQSKGKMDGRFRPGVTIREPNLIGKSHFETTVQNRDGSQTLLPKVDWIYWDFQSLDLLGFDSFDDGLLDKQLSRISKTIDAKKRADDFWHGHTFDVAIRKHKKIKDLFRQHRFDYNTLPQSQHQSMDHSKNQSCCKFHAELKVRLKKLLATARLDFFGELVRQYELAFGENDPRIADARELLAASYIDLNDKRNARQQLQQAKFLRYIASKSKNPLHQIHRDTTVNDYLQRKASLGYRKKLQRTRSRNSSAPNVYTSVKPVSNLGNRKPLVSEKLKSAPIDFSIFSSLITEETKIHFHSSNNSESSQEENSVHCS